jgi:hypothetical protein
MVSVRMGHGSRSEKDYEMVLGFATGHAGERADLFFTRGRDCPPAPITAPAITTHYDIEDRVRAAPVGHKPR